jgi:hypothetical protein
MLPAYFSICINTDKFPHDSVRLLLLHQHYSRPIIMGHNNARHMYTPDITARRISSNQSLFPSDPSHQEGFLDDKGVDTT